MANPRGHGVISRAVRVSEVRVISAAIGNSAIDLSADFECDIDGCVAHKINSAADDRLRNRKALTINGIQQTRVRDLYIMNDGFVAEFRCISGKTWRAKTSGDEERNGEAQKTFGNERRYILIFHAFSLRPKFLIG